MAADPKEAGHEGPGTNSAVLSEDSKAFRRRALRATLRVFLPFVLAGGVALLFRMWATDKAAESIAALAVEVQRARDSRAPDKELERLATVGHADDAAARIVRPRLVRSLAEDLAQERLPASPAGIKQHVRQVIIQGSLTVDILVESLLILFFPGLFSAMFMQAARELSPQQRRAIAESPSGFTLEAEVRILRCQNWLDDEARWLFLRRAGFALVIALGTNYLLSPAGLQASAIGEYASLSPPAGFSSHPFGLEYFAHAPPYVVGFAGYYLHAMTAYLTRFMSGSLSHRVFPALLNRAVFVMILGLVLAGITEGEGLTRALVFTAAIFPETGMQYLARLTQTAAGQLHPDLAAGFRALPEIDIYKQAALAELGVSSVHDLAGTDWRVLVSAVGINPLVLLRAADRALLLHSAGVEQAGKLTALSVFTASDLVLYARGDEVYAERLRTAQLAVRFPLVGTLTQAEKSERLDAIAHALGVQDASLLVEQLTTVRNVRFIIDSKVIYGGL